MLILIGSSALDHHIELGRKPVDTDIICSYDEAIQRFGHYSEIFPINKGKKLVFKDHETKSIIEAEITWPDSSAEWLASLIILDSKTIVKFDHRLSEKCIIPNFDVLYTLKMSHRYLRNSPHFLKTMRDIQLLRKLGCKDIPDLYKEWYKARVKETYWYKHPNLKTSKDAFFKDDVSYIYDHDDIHRSVAHLEKPAYEYYQVDNEEVLCSKDKFYSVDESIRLYGVLEEAYVLALERHQIPNNFQPDEDESFKIALMKVCTSITSGWFREFAWENYDNVMSMHAIDYCYVAMFQKALKDGKVRPYKK